MCSSDLQAPGSGIGERSRGRVPGGGEARAREHEAADARGGVGAGRGEEGAAPRAARSLSRREETERTFLALCIASPEDGARALEALDPDEHFTSERLRRAAVHLSGGRLVEPMAAIDEQDPELTSVLAELVVQAGREFPVPAMLDVQRMQLELARLDRRIRGASGAQGSGEVVSELAHRRAEVKRAFEQAYERALEETGG